MHITKVKTPHISSTGEKFCNHVQIILKETKHLIWNGARNFTHSRTSRAKRNFPWSAAYWKMPLEHQRSTTFGNMVSEKGCSWEAKHFIKHFDLHYLPVFLFLLGSLLWRIFHSSILPLNYDMNPSLEMYSMIYQQWKR